MSVGKLLKVPVPGALVSLIVGGRPLFEGSGALVCDAPHADARGEAGPA